MKPAAAIAVANQKGGVGKTTTAINLGAALAVLERRVLVVDCDPQGNATRGLGLEAEEPNLYQVLLERAPVRAAVRPTRLAGLDVLPSDRDLVGAEVELVDLPDWERRLARRVVEELRGSYELIFLDCPPSLGRLTVNALVAADGVLVPLQCEYFALEGITELLHTVRRVQGGLNPQLRIAGILLTMYDERTNLSKDVANEVRRHFPVEVLETVVPRNVRLAEAPSYGLPVLQYDVRSRGAQAFLALAHEFQRRI